MPRFASYWLRPWAIKIRHFGCFPFNNSVSAQVPNGTVHSVCTDPTRATARLVIVLVRTIQKSGTRENNFVKMERDNSVGPTEMTGPVKVDHLQRCPQIFQSDRTELVRFISNRNFRNFGLNGKRPSISMAAWIQPVNCCCDCERR